MNNNQEYLLFEPRGGTCGQGGTGILQRLKPIVRQRYYVVLFGTVVRDAVCIADHFSLRGNARDFVIALGDVDANDEHCDHIR